MLVEMYLRFRNIFKHTWQQFVWIILMTSKLYYHFCYALKQFQFSNAQCLLLSENVAPSSQQNIETSKSE